MAESRGHEVSVGTASKLPSQPQLPGLGPASDQHQVDQRRARAQPELRGGPRLQGTAVGHAQVLLRNVLHGLISNFNVGKNNDCNIAVLPRIKDQDNLLINILFPGE